eukprot:TRINITY_DN8736_c0_g1_i1.p1 TRINITY_DN8736_c0_g1~~TRINITY_DN8736_c0_g1_i1.p1  ORF type:complete len:189 (-),score=19.01 TRINITY_DN8736_c0_g1_i1:167-733(-)
MMRTVGSKIGKLYRKCCCKYRQRAGTVPVSLNPSTDEVEYLLIQNRTKTGWIFPGIARSDHVAGSVEKGEETLEAAVRETVWRSNGSSKRRECGEACFAKLTIMSIRCRIRSRLFIFWELPLSTVLVGGNSADDYEEKKVGRQRKWHNFETALKLIGDRKASVEFLMEAAAASKRHKGKIPHRKLKDE